MANNTLDKAIEAIPNFGERTKLFTEKLRPAQYADSSIYDYRLNIAQDEMKPILFRVVHFRKYLMSQKFAAKVLTFYEMGNTRVTEYLQLY